MPHQQESFFSTSVAIRLSHLQTGIYEFYRHSGCECGLLEARSYRLSCKCPQSWQSVPPLHGRPFSRRPIEVADTSAWQVCNWIFAVPGAQLGVCEIGGDFFLSCFRHRHLFYTPISTCAAGLPKPLQNLHFSCVIHPRYYFFVCTSR